jgi:hypothetical protein
MYHEYLETSWQSRLARLCIPPLLTYMRVWDTLSSERVDTFIAISSMWHSESENITGANQL